MKKDILLIILVMLVLGLGGYLVYENIMLKDGDSNQTINDEEVEKTTDISITELVFDGIAITYNGEVYVSLGSMSGHVTLDNVFGEGTIQIWNEVINNKYKVYEFDGLNYLDSNNSKFKGLKLNVDNVKQVYSANVGQSITRDLTLFLLHNDNTISRITIYSLINGMVEVTKIEDLSDVVDIVTESVPMGGFKSFAVTSTGEKINLDKYILEDQLSF